MWGLFDGCLDVAVIWRLFDEPLFGGCFDVAVDVNCRYWGEGDGFVNIDQRLNSAT